MIYVFIGVTLFVIGIIVSDIKYGESDDFYNS